VTILKAGAGRGVVVVAVAVVAAVAVVVVVVVAAVVAADEHDERGARACGTPALPVCACHVLVQAQTIRSCAHQHARRSRTS
jgi:hypothetical protein